MKKYKYIITTLLSVAIGATIFYACQKENVDNSNDANKIQKSYNNSMSEIFYSGVEYTYQQIILEYPEGIDSSSVDKTTFMQLFHDIYLNYLNNNGWDAFNTYDSISTDEINCFVTLTDTGGTLSKQDRIDLRNDFIDNQGIGYNLSPPALERAIAYAQMLNGSENISVTFPFPIQQLKTEGDSRFERRLHAAVENITREIFNHPIRAAAFVAGLPESFIWVLAEATYDVATGKYNHIS